MPGERTPNLGRVGEGESEQRRENEKVRKINIPIIFGSPRLQAQNTKRED